MTEADVSADPDAEGESRAPTPIGWRLILTIALVSLLSLVLLAGLTLVFASIDVAAIGQAREETLAKAVESAVAANFTESGTWSNVELAPTLAFATRAGMAVDVTDKSGHQVAQASPGPSHRTALRAPIALPIIVDGHRVGTVTVRIGTTGIFVVGESLRGALVVAVGGTAAVIAVIAVIAGSIAARRIIRSIESLTRAARAVAAGERHARVGDVEAPGELAELSSVFDYMADTIEREDELRRTIVADIAHELRTPLAVLQASTEALADGITEPDPHTLYSLRDETLRMSRFVEDLEVLASAQAAGLTTNRTPVDLGHVASAAADAIEAQVVAADLTFERDLEPVMVLGDETRLHQVVTNLLSNAVKFTPPGGHITLTVRSTGSRVELSVADTGVGIPPDELPHIFERFWRGSAARRVAGSGIGLAVVAELVQANGGKIEVRLSGGDGTCFVVTLAPLGSGNARRSPARAGVPASTAGPAPDPRAGTAPPAAP